MWGLWKKSDMLCNIWQCSYNMGIWNKGKGRHDVKKDVLKLTARDSICYKAGIARQKGEKWEGREVLNIVWIHAAQWHWQYKAWANNGSIMHEQKRLMNKQRKKKGSQLCHLIFIFAWGLCWVTKQDAIYSQILNALFLIENLLSVLTVLLCGSWRVENRSGNLFRVSSNFTAQQRITPKSNIRIEALLWSNSLHLKQA